jgi:D-alanyl-D-alanine-carboxypeptidase/D-alanyl-D-alanine-endopeptidase
MKRRILIFGIACAMLMGAWSRNLAAARQAAAKPKEVAVDTKILAGYVGRYQLTPASVLTIRLNGDHLYAIAQGQQLAEMYPSSQKDFFLDAADTTFTFVTDSEGKATEIVLHIGGQDQHARRVQTTPSN